MHNTKPLPEEIIIALGSKLHDGRRVGSREICNPPPTDTDEDWLVLVGENPEKEMSDAGYVREGGPNFYTGNDNGGFISWRKEETNVITTQSEEFFDRFMTATYLAKRFNLKRKADRIALFQAVLYGVRIANLEAEPWDPEKEAA